MGFFDAFKSTRDIAKEEIKEIPWHMITSMKDLDTIAEESKDKTIAIFKHSTRCGISRMVLKQFEKNYSIEEKDIKLYYLDLIENRDISSEIAARFQVSHESPQLLLIKGGKVVHHDSHHGIDAGHLEKFI